MSPLRWTCKSTSKLAAELRGKGYLISARTVVRIPAKEIANSDLMSIKIEASSRWTVIC
jgi:Rhodopirellula transposase DDE domain